MVPDGMAVAILDRAAVVAAMKWQPIETAPKDGTRILGWIPDLDVDFPYIDIPGAATISWDQVYSCWEVDPAETWEYSPEKRNPTHWMPLPEAPD